METTATTAVTKATPFDSSRIAEAPHIKFSYPEPATPTPSLSMNITADTLVDCVDAQQNRDGA